ncbi:YqaE/Pmp3 family membrane protein [Acaryochloris sp. CCMEE 5410]|uniref:YqaE/Pmp3 family membrane protein n=1 Tax=Acaryochloris sp. CCMEE 5410 TaxID=310037 RepID=UPI0002484EC5|nr:YqaE/Pmp3 family membrane protein [Acaryochloris sp. CCMEE 5410]
MDLGRNQSLTLNLRKIMSPIQLALAIILPPVSIFFDEGFSVTLIINTLLTLIAWIPGSIHAVWVLSKRAQQAST